MDIMAGLTAVFIAIGFAGWPIISSYSRASGGWVGMVVSVSTALAVVIFSAKNLSSIPAPNLRALVLLLIAGVFNGLALCLYSFKVADTNVPTAAFVVMISIMMAMVAPVLNWMLNSAVPNQSQMLGFGFAVVAIYFLSK